MSTSFEIRELTGTRIGTVRALTAVVLAITSVAFALSFALI